MEYKQKPPGWEMTDPRCHDPKSFRYLVTTTSRASIEYAAQRSRSWGETNTPMPKNWEGLIEEMLKRNSLSFTVIDENHRATYKQDVMPQALIFNVPPENIVGLDHTDLGTHYHIQDKTAREAHSFFKPGAKLLSEYPEAQAFLEACSPTFRNEVLVDGIGPEGRQIRIAGVIFFTDPKSGIPYYEQFSRYSWNPLKVAHRIFRFGDTDEVYTVRRYREEYGHTKDLAKLLDIPIIHIPAATTLLQVP